MEDTTISIIGIFIAVIIMFIVPLILISDRADDISQLTIQTATANFVDNVIKSGKITNDDYDDFVQMISTTGNAYDVEMELKILDPNSAKQYTVASPSGDIGPNTYYSIFASQIEEKLKKSDISDDGELNNTGVLILKDGDFFSVTAKNKSLTLSQSLKNIYYKIKGESMHIILATASGTVAINGAT